MHLQINMNKGRILILICLVILTFNIIAEETASEYPKLGDKKIDFTDKSSVDWDGEVSKTINTAADLGDRNSFIVKTGSINSRYNGESRKYGSFDSEFENKFTFNRPGKLIEARFKAGADGKYKLGDKEVDVPKGAIVEYRDGKITITGGEKRKLIAPLKPSDSKDYEDTAIEWKNDNGFILANGEDFKGILKYKNGFYFDSEAKIGNYIEIKNPNGVATYLDYDGTSKPGIDGAYISINKEKGWLTLGCNVNVRGPTVSFLKGVENPYGVKMESRDFFSMQALGNSEGSFISLYNREKSGLIPQVQTLNQFLINDDGKAVWYNTDDKKLYMSVNNIFPNNEYGSQRDSMSTPLEIWSWNKINGKTEYVSAYKSILGIGNKNNIGYGSNPRFIRTNTLEYYRQLGASALYTGFSNRLEYNYDLSVRGFEKLTGVKIVDQVGATRDLRVIQMLMDMMISVPTNNLRKYGISTIRLQNWGGFAGRCNSEDGLIELNVGSGSLTPRVLKHEMMHARDFGLGDYGSAWRREWSSIGGDVSGTQTYDYGNQEYEDVSTFGEFTYSNNAGDNSWKGWLTGPLAKSYKARLAVLVKYNFISQPEAARIYALVGLASDSNSLNKYIADAKRT